YLAECQNALAVGGTLRDSSFQVFWNVLRRFDLRPCSDLFDLLDSNDVIEVYRYDFIQIYRNLRFLELCTYSLDEVFSYEWPELFHRKQEINFELFDLTREILSGAKKTTLK